MKLSFIDVSGFRGFLEPCRVDLPAGFAVLTGRNGAGKSSLFDAFDFALTGTINKFDVKAAKGGGLDRHIWWVGDGKPEECYVKIGFEDENGNEHILCRTRTHGLRGATAKIKELLVGAFDSHSSWADALTKTSLIRDEHITALSLDLPEQARFAAVKDAIGSLAGPDHDARLSSIGAQAERAYRAQKEVVENLNEELHRRLSALTEAQSAIQNESDIQTALETMALT